jgi:hypothetical protein
MNNMNNMLKKLIRKNVEFNACEYVDAILLAHKASFLCNYKNTITYEDICSMSEKWIQENNIIVQLKLNKFSDLQHYVADLLKKPDILKQRIKTFNDLIGTTTIKFENIVVIYISGKKNLHEKINKLNKNIDNKHAKSDIYIEYISGDFIGWSCKQSCNATKSNYSVHKILGPQISNKLNMIKKELLTSNGFPKFSKQDRESVNKLFYPNKENLYWTQLRFEIANANQLIISVLLNCLHGANMPYNIYEFDGTSITNNSNHAININKVIFEEYAPYYMTHNGEFRNAAKLFYRLCVDEKKYRVEIRWKGNIHNASPQFMIHNI